MNLKSYERLLLLITLAKVSGLCGYTYNMHIYVYILTCLVLLDPVQFRATDERYLDNCRVYEAAKLKANPVEGSNNKQAANVLSLFSGIGAGILVLKRLKIAINNCIVVEHDPLAEAVCSGNHKNDVAKYIRIKKFEELEDKLDEYMEQYGPIHVVEGGPPCIECKFVMLCNQYCAIEEGLSHLYTIHTLFLL